MIDNLIFRSVMKKTYPDSTAYTEISIGSAFVSVKVPDHTKDPLYDVLNG
jgi:hypothetical protein